MFGIGSTELLVILVVALLVLGPKKLPQIARSLGKGMAEFRRVSSDFSRTISTDVEREEMEEKKAREKKRMFEEEKKAEKASTTATAKEAAEAEPAPQAEAATAEPVDTAEKAEPVKESQA